jgi:Domain of unknown function (DUF4149)
MKLLPSAIFKKKIVCSEQHAIFWRLASLLTALWWGSLTALGAVFVPTIFATLMPKAAAGQMAGALFHVQFYLSAGCVILLIGWHWVAFRLRLKHSCFRKNCYCLGSALICILVLEYVVSPLILKREDLIFWHSVGTGVFIVQWVIVTQLLWKHSGVGLDYR